MINKQNNNDCAFEYYEGTNGQKIKVKERKHLNYYTDTVNFGVLFIDLKETEFWNSLIHLSHYHVYVFESSIFFDFGDDFYYELCHFDKNIGETYNYIIANKKSYIAKFNKELAKFEEAFEVDIVIL